MSDDSDYLQPGFEPSSLTVPRLRSILVAHAIPYPSGAKKSQLIEIFMDSVVPQAPKILAQRARAKRSSRGIVDAESSAENSTQNTSTEDLMPPPPTPRTRSVRKPSAKLKVTDESESDAPSIRSPTKRTPRASSKHARASDTETGTDLDGVRRTVRKSRKSEAAPTPVPAPKVKREIDDGAGVSRRETAFTFDNPFQSGSSPLSEGRSVSGERPRKSHGTSSTKRKSSSTRIRTDGPKVEDGIHPPTSATFMIPVSELNKDVDDNGVEIGEDFTPEAQLELAQEQALNGVNALGPRRQKRKQSDGMGKAGPIWVVLLTLLGGYATWYRQEKIAVGYCGVGRDATQIIPAGVQVPEWAKILVEPECELCPQHAYCTENLETHCEADFVLKPHPLSLGGLVPLTPTCEPDGEKVRRVKAVADRAVEELRERRAKWECGDLVDEAGAPEPTVQVDADALKKEVSKKRRKGMGEAEFEELWAGAIGEIEGREEVVSAADGHRKLLTSTSLTRLPFGCAVRRSFRLAVARHRIEIASIIASLTAGLYIRHLITSRATTNAAIPGLVAHVLDKLVEQATLYAQDREEHPDGFISIGQLRDDVLRREHSFKKREAIWSRVRKVVEMNSNVRSSQRESRNGDISRVWEWVGAIGNLESGGASASAGGERGRWKSGGRVSWGVYDELSSPVSGNDGGPEVVQLKWQEGRPIY